MILHSYKNISYSRDSLSAKEVLAYVLLILYFFATFKPVLPIAADILAHTFWNSNHIKSVHHHHGSQHVEAEIAQSEHNDDKSQKEATKFAEPVAIHMASKISYNFLFYFFKERDDFNFLPFVPTPHLDINYPPPKS